MVVTSRAGEEEARKYPVLCNYRKLNNITKKDSYPLPRIDHTLGTLSGMKWISTLNLKSGYWQVEMHSKDKEKTAFSTGKGLWQFNVIHFGLHNAPATYKRLMGCVLTGLARVAGIWMTSSSLAFFEDYF